jgi:hypothetical protein
MLVSILRERDDATDSGWGLTLVCATGTHQDGHVAMLKVRFSQYGSERWDDSTSDWSAGSTRMDDRKLEDFASCCGVNLVVADGVCRSFGQLEEFLKCRALDGEPQAERLKRRALGVAP